MTSVNSLSRGLKSRLLLTTAIGLGLCLPALASGDYVVDTPSTTTNDGHTINAFDTLTVTPSGSITTIGDDAVDFTADSVGITVQPGGSITTSGTGASGIYGVGNSNTVLNDGTIVTNDGSAHTIYLNGDENVITNNGMLTTSGADSVGVFVRGTNPTVTNNGSISTSGYATYGIFFLNGDVGTITNNGDVHTSGNGSNAIYALPNSVTVINRGTLTTTGADADALLAVGDAVEIENSGSIMTAGSNAGAIFTQGAGNEITNSGKLVSQLNASIFIAGDDSTLNLNAPSFLGGFIGVAGNNVTLNIETAPSHSVLWHFTPSKLAGGKPTVTGTVPGFYDDVSGQFATYDPTGLAANADRFAVFSELVSDLSDPTSRGEGFWIQGFGAHAQFDGDAKTLDRTLAFGGVAVGGDWMLQDRMTIGGALGYATGSTTVSGPYTDSWNNDTDSFFANVHGQYDFGAFRLGFGLSGGLSAHEDKRFVNDNLAQTNGLTIGQSWASSSYDSLWISPEVTVSKEIAAGNGYVLTPSARLRYGVERFDGHNEAGSNANATVGDYNVDLGELKLELAVTKKVGRQVATLRGGYIGQTSFGDFENDVSLIGVSQTVSADGISRNQGFIGGDLQFALGETAHLKASANAVFSSSGEPTLSGALQFDKSF